MPQPDTALDLDQLFDAVIASIRGAFPQFEMVDAYPEDRRQMPVPACLIDLIELEPTDDPGTEQLAVIAHFEASIVLPFRAPRAKRAVAKLAAAIAHHVQGRRWGLPIAPAQVISIAPSDFDPELDRFETWSVEWQQTVHIGESIWNDDGTPPTQVLAAWSPDIGPTHEAEYTDIGQATA